jgi:hypothetical protein
VHKSTEKRKQLKDKELLVTEARKRKKKNNKTPKEKD